MSSESLLLIFFVFSGYPSIFVLGDNSVVDAAAKLSSPTKPSTVLGTLWCGRDSQAKSYDSLGPATETDKCCRQWQDCHEFIAPKKSKYGLHNNNNYKLFDCHCTDEFHQCLKSVTGLEAWTAQEVGIAYFNLVKPKCLMISYTSLCKDAYYDKHGNKHSNNNQRNYFCPHLIHSQAW